MVVTLAGLVLLIRTLQLHITSCSRSLLFTIPSNEPFERWVRVVHDGPVSAIQCCVSGDSECVVDMQVAMNPRLLQVYPVSTVGYSAGYGPNTPSMRP